MDPEGPADADRRARRLNPTLLALLAGVAVLLLVVAYFATNRNAGQDKLTGNELAGLATPNAELEKRCASNATYDLIKRELFRRAAQMRGSDQAAYDQLAAVAVVRMENAVLESENGSSGSVNCSGSLSLDLPPGVAAAGGRTTLMADIDYAVDANGGVTLGNAGAVIGQLAGLSRTAPPPPATPETNAVAPAQPEANAAASQSANVQPGPPTVYQGRPSFDCAMARRRGEIAVCSDSGLSALDLNMATQYRRALTGASSEQKALLQQTAASFYAYRDRCPNRQCIADGYLGRMREVRDIMEGRWRPR